MAGYKINRKRFIFHLCTVLHHFLVFYYFAVAALDARKVDHEWVRSLETYQGRFLTVWNFVIQTLYFKLCILQDILEVHSISHLQKINHCTRKMNSYIFRTLVFPLSPVITLMFWSIYLIDRELVFPKILDEFFPLWLNHGLHTFSTVASFAEMFVTFNWYPVSRWKALCGITACKVAYAVCFFSTYYFDGVWLYPLFTIASWGQRISLVLLLYIGTILMYIYGEYLNSQKWGHEILKLKEKKTSDKNK